MLRQLDRCVRSTHKELESAYEAGDCAAVHSLSNELVNLVSLTEQPTRNQMETYRYLAMTQVAVRRHDRAVDLATKMIFLARTCNDVELMVQALVTLGKVHLSFGHVQVLVRAWQQLLPDIQAVSSRSFPCRQGGWSPLLYTFSDSLLPRAHCSMRYLGLLNCTTGKEFYSRSCVLSDSVSATKNIIKILEMTVLEK